MPIYLSASSIKDFIQCPQKVLYRITKPFPLEQSREMIVGIVSHSVFEKGWRDRDTAKAVLEQELKNYKLPQSDINDISFYIDMFFLNFRHMLYEEDVIEHQFKIPIYDNVFIVGKMDRISRGNIFDWKTGAKQPKNLSGNVQCMIYDFAYRELYHKEPSSVCLADIAEGKLVPYQRNEMMYRQLFTNIIPRMIKTIKNESYEKLGLFNGGCYRCVYKKGCLAEVK